MRAAKFDRATHAPVLVELHWLLVKQRSVCKLALVTFNVLHTSNPVYLRDLRTAY